MFFCLRIIHFFVLFRVWLFCLPDIFCDYSIVYVLDWIGILVNYIMIKYSFEKLPASSAELPNSSLTVISDLICTVPASSLVIW